MVLSLERAGVSNADGVTGSCTQKRGCKVKLKRERELADRIDGRQ